MKQFLISGKNSSFRRCGQRFPAHPDTQMVAESTFTKEEWKTLKNDPDLIVQDSKSADTPNGSGNEGSDAGNKQDDKSNFPWDKDLGADRKDLSKLNKDKLSTQCDDLLAHALELGLDDDVAKSINPETKAELVSAIVWLEQFIADNTKNGDNSDTNSGSEGKDTSNQGADE